MSISVCPVGPVHPNSLNRHHISAQTCPRSGQRPCSHSCGCTCFFQPLFLTILFSWSPSTPHFFHIQLTKPQLPATTASSFSEIPCPALSTSSMSSLCPCEYLWTFSKIKSFPCQGAWISCFSSLFHPLNPQLQTDPGFPKALVLFYPVFCCRLLTLQDTGETLKFYLARCSQTPTPLTPLPGAQGNGHRLSDERGWAKCEQTDCCWNALCTNGQQRKDVFLLPSAEKQLLQS